MGNRFLQIFILFFYFREALCEVVYEIADGLQGGRPDVPHASPEVLAEDGGIVMHES